MVRIRFVFLVIEMLALACWLMPGIAEPARGAIQLISIFGWGGFLGSCFAARRGRGR